MTEWNLQIVRECRTLKHNIYDCVSPQSDHIHRNWHDILVK